MDETKVIHPDHEDPRWCESLEDALGLPSDTADTVLCPVTWPGASEHPTTRVHVCERTSGHGGWCECECAAQSLEADR